MALISRGCWGESSEAIRACGSGGILEQGGQKEVIRTSRSENILMETENYFVEGYNYNSPKVVVTFEPAGQPFERPQGFRIGWAGNVLRAKKISHLCVKPKTVDWYRRPDLVKGFEAIDDIGFFTDFDEIITYGGSMGGFAAMVFADFIGAKTVFSINPQTTLDLDKVPWERRFARAQEYGWKGPFSDAAECMSGVENLYVCVDRMCAEDWKHIARLPKQILSKITLLNLPFVGHELPGHMNAINVLVPLLDQIVSDTFDINTFRLNVRKRRNLKRYYNTLNSMHRVQGSPLFQRIVDLHKNRTSRIGME